MDVSTYIIAGFMGVLGIWISAYFVWVLFWPTLKSLGGKRDKNRYRKAAESIVEADVQIQSKQYREALDTLRKAPLYDIFPEPQLIALAREHHQNLLSRLVVIAEELQTRTDHLGDVERLTIERNELSVLLLRAQESYASLLSRRKNAGKDIPTWSKSDFQQRVNEIHKELDGNRRALSTAFDKLFSAIESGKRESTIVYH